MYKKAILLLLLALPCVAIAQDKVAYVSTQQILTKMPEFKDYQTKMTFKQDSLQKEAAAIQEEYNAKMEEFSKTADQELPAATISDRQLQMNKIQERYEALMQFSQVGMQQVSVALLTPIQQKLNDAIEAVGKESGVTYIMDQGSFQYTGSTAVDLTRQVETKLGLN